MLRQQNYPMNKCSCSGGRKNRRNEASPRRESSLSGKIGLCGREQIFMEIESVLRRGRCPLAAALIMLRPHDWITDSHDPPMAGV
jgi:hypothetical protein